MPKLDGQRTAMNMLLLYLFYISLAGLVLLGEYLKVLPMGSTVTIFGLIVGHGIGTFPQQQKETKDDGNH